METVVTEVVAATRGWPITDRETVVTEVVAATRGWPITDRETVVCYD